MELKLSYYMDKKERKIIITEGNDEEGEEEENDGRVFQCCRRDLEYHQVSLHESLV